MEPFSRTHHDIGCLETIVLPTFLPDKQWFVDKLNRSIMIAKEYGERESKKEPCRQKIKRAGENFSPARNVPNGNG
jgi:hypothetical protein